jgi:hypothetical protein
MIPLSVVAKATLILIVALVALRWTHPAAASVRLVRGRLGCAREREINGLVSIPIRGAGWQ